MSSDSRIFHNFYFADDISLLQSVMMCTSFIVFISLLQIGINVHLAILVGSKKTMEVREMINICFLLNIYTYIYSCGNYKSYYSCNYTIINV